MNRISLIVLMVFLAGCSIAKCQTNFYEHVSSLWFSGKKGEVLQIAEQRLGKNTNDIAGLLLKIEYQSEMLQFGGITNDMTKVLEVSKKYSGTNFSKAFPLLKDDFEILNDAITNYPPEEYAADLKKTNTVGKTMSFSPMIKALQKDGYFATLPDTATNMDSKKSTNTSK